MHGTFKVKADPFSLESLAAWLEAQDPEAEYSFWDCDGGCLIGLYGASLGVEWREMHALLKNAGRIHIASEFPRTFGGALERTRTLLPLSVE